MELNASKTEDVLTLSLIGNLDYHGIKEVEEIFNELTAHGHKVIVNFKGIEYISNTGLLFFKKISEEFNEKNQPLQFKGASHFIRESFELAGIDNLFIWLEGGI